MSKEILKVGINQRFHTINEALSMACKGDEIVIQSGIYKESIKIDKDINIIGVSSEKGEKPLIVIGKNRHFDINAKVNISNLEICQNQSPRYYIPEQTSSYKTRLEYYCNDCKEENNNQLIRIYDDCIFENCIIRDSVKNIVPVFCFKGSSSFYNCIFKHAQQCCICIDTSSFCQVSNCKFIDNFAGIKVMGYMQVSACEFQNTVFTNIYALDFSKSLVYGCSLSNAYVNIYITGNEAYLKCNKSKLTQGKVNNIHVCKSSKVYVDNTSLFNAGENSILAENNSVIKVMKSEIGNNKKGIVIKTSNDYLIQSCKIINNTECGIHVLNGGNYSEIKDSDFINNSTGLYIEAQNNIDLDDKNTNDNNELSSLIPDDLLLDFTQLNYSFLFSRRNIILIKILDCNFNKNNIGIKQEKGWCCTYQKCNISQNKESGISVKDCYGNYIEDSLISDNESYGIYMEGKSEIKLIRCNLLNNKRSFFKNNAKAFLDFISCNNNDDEEITSDN